MVKRSSDEADLGNEEAEARARKTNRSSSEIYNIVSPYLIDRGEIRATARDLGNLKAVSHRALEGVEWTTARADYIDRINRLGRIADNLCDILFIKDNKKAARWVDSSVPEPRPTTEHPMHESFSIGEKIGTSHCVDILKPLLPLLSDDHKSVITDGISAIPNVSDQTEILTSISKYIETFREAEQSRMIDISARIINNRAKYGRSINPDCESAIAFICHVEHVLGDSKPELKNRITQIFSSNSEKRDDIREAVQSARAQAAQATPPDLPPPSGPAVLLVD